MEENPIVFGKAVEGSYFTNRTKNPENLEANLAQGIKKSLLKKDLIDIDGSIITYNDPLFKLWIKKNIPNI